MEGSGDCRSELQPLSASFSPASPHGFCGREGPPLSPQLSRAGGELLSLQQPSKGCPLLCAAQLLWAVRCTPNLLRSSPQCHLRSPLPGAVGREIESKDLELEARVTPVALPLPGSYPGTSRSAPKLCTPQSPQHVVNAPYRFIITMTMPLIPPTLQGLSRSVTRVSLFSTLPEHHSPER